MVETLMRNRYMSTLSKGWRLTVPTHIRRAKGWDEGTILIATSSGRTLYLASKHEADEQMQLNQDSISSECRLGSGGKIMIPAKVRKHLRWQPQRRLVVTDEGSAVSVTPCCSPKKCRSCGATDDVEQVIPNLYLCGGCFHDYARKVRPVGGASRAF